MMRKGQSSVALALDGVLSSLESGVRIRENQALYLWAHVTGPQVAAASEAVSVYEGVLIVRTRSSVWSQQLSFMKATILAELNKRIGKPVLRDIVFRAEGLPEPAPTETAPEMPTEEELAAIQLPPAEEAALRDKLSQLQNIADVSLRERLLRCIERDHRLRHWRLQHGWRVCRECTAVHKSEDELCPICRICR